MRHRGDDKMTPFLEHTPVVNESFDCNYKGMKLGSIFFGRLINTLAHWVLTEKKFRVTIEHNPEDPYGRTNVKYEFIE